MKSDWKFGILDDAVDKGSSNISLNKIKDDGGEFPVFGAKGFVQNVSFYQQENQYLAIIKDGAGIGRVSIHPEKSSVLATMQYILPKQSYDIKFLYYFLNSIDFNKYRTGSTIPHIYYKNYKLEPFPLVSKEEQKRIVAKLDSSFEAIDKAKANAAKNLENAKELFQSKLNDIFSQKGEGWVEKKLGDVAFVKSGGTPLRSTVDFWDNGKIPWYSSGELNHLYTKESNRYITQQGLDNSNAKLFPKGSLLVGMYDTAALKMSIIDRDATFNQAIAGVKPSKELNLIFLLHSINAIKKDLLNQRRGVRQKNLSLTKIKNITFSVPPLSIQNTIVSELEHLKNQTQSLEFTYQQELNSLEELKKSILQKAFEGEL